jgi:DNA-binding phage protein
MRLDSALQGLALAREQRKDLDLRKREATKRLVKFSLAALDAGASVTQVAKEAGLSRQGLYDLLGDRRPSR